MTDAIQAVYDGLPALACQGKCQAVCGPITATPPEYTRVMRRQRKAIGAGHGRQACGLLDEQGACTIYEDRPLICRLVGLTHETACPHGCTPARWLTEDEAYSAWRAVATARS